MIKKERKKTHKEDSSPLYGDSETSSVVRGPIGLLPVNSSLKKESHMTYLRKNHMKIIEEINVPIS